MLKGVQRKLIVLKTNQSDLFESAYFILRDIPDEPRLTQNEMLREATRILRENSHTGSHDRAGCPSPILFLIGFFSGVLAVGLLWLFAL